MISVREYNKLPLKVHFLCDLLSMEWSLDREDDPIGSYCEEVLLRPRAKFSWNSNTSLAANRVQFSLYNTFKSSVILQSLSTVRALSSMAAVSSSILGTTYDPPSFLEPGTSRSFAESCHGKQIDFTHIYNPYIWPFRKKKVQNHLRITRLQINFGLFYDDLYTIFLAILFLSILFITYNAT